eukprot:TRINITY_DN2950_c0_g1_i2.p1 TRINITY_DN2950_c0_g1~~TRINITY_DN2950_c0_g1_i2.p1  ORF type:complete len:535 (-),score=203.54 TRINITY_DN2950_c0_g1_i2:114-1718(-)
MAEKKKEKERNEQCKKEHGTALVDGHEERVGNFMIEPPGLFLGRGNHPLTGKLKRRVLPEDVIINIGKNAEVPKCPMSGHHWKEVVNNREVMWLAFWRENVRGAFKYVWLHSSSSLKGMSDMKKYEKARTLKVKIKRIRQDYTKDLVSKLSNERQRATALYLIDKLALRVGNEKGDDEADTVGCCSLRVEHINLTNTEEKPNTVSFDFLGKDSMRYQNTVQVDPLVYRNLAKFSKGKDAGENLFDELSTTVLNKYLKDFMPGLSAKVFRTYNASITLEQELAKAPEDLVDDTVDAKFLFYNRANRQVAILCNHQRTIKENVFSAGMGKLKARMHELQKERDLLVKQIAKLSGKKKKPKKEKDGSSDSEYERIRSDDSDIEEFKKVQQEREKLQKERKEREAREQEQEKKEKKKKDGKKGAKDEDDSSSSEDEDKKPRKSTVHKPFTEKDLPDDVGKCEKRLALCRERMERLQTLMTDKGETKNYALNTSKLNYIDPRITAAWCKKVKLPIEKVFAKTIRDKFKWAMEVDEDFKF